MTAAATLAAVLHQLREGEASTGDLRDIAWCADQLEEVAAPVQTLQSAIVEIVTEEPGSTSGDVRQELSARGIRTAATSVVATALSRLVKSGALIRQEMRIAAPPPSAAREAPKSRGGGDLVVYCYRPVPPTEPTP